MLLILFVSPCSWALDSSGINSEEKALKIAEGKSKIGNTIPCKTPYELNACVALAPLFLSPQGIARCSIVKRAERT